MNGANGELLCDMERGCKGEITHIDDKGYIYCRPHGIQRKGYRPCRLLTSKELRQLKAGQPLASYRRSS